jgi:hypothetical protein
MAFAQHVLREVLHSNELMLPLAPWKTRDTDFVSIPDLFGDDVLGADFACAIPERLGPTFIQN